MKTLEIHPLSAVWPQMTAAEKHELIDDIKVHGVIEPIMLFDGKVLDGFHRYNAALKAGVKCPTKQYTGDDPAGYVISRNARRRHLTQRTLAIAIAKCRELPLVGRPKESDQSDQINQPTTKQMADEGGVSVPTMRRAVQEIKRERGELPPKPVAPAGPTPKEKLQAENQKLKETQVAKEDKIRQLEQKNKALTDATKDPTGKLTQTMKTIGNLQGEVSVLKGQVGEWQSKYKDEVRAHKQTKALLKQSVAREKKLQARIEKTNLAA